MFWDIDSVRRDDDDGWSCTYSLKNTHSGAAVPSLGSNCAGPFNGTIRWIREYGFYEGTVPFRVDPGALYNIISGAL